MIQVDNSESPKKKLGINDYQILQRLGRGSYGQVFKVVKKDNLKIYAMKQILKRRLKREEKEYQAIVEKELLTRIEHPGVIKILASFQDADNLYFVLELCEGGDFKDLICMSQNKCDENSFRFYIAEIVNILEYLHEHGIVHRDLKPQNIMLTKQGHLKLIDFGSAQFSKSDLVVQKFKDRIQEQKRISQQKYSNSHQNQNKIKEDEITGRRSTFVGTSYYISPELLQFNICQPPSDLWALGCCIYQYYYGKTPFADCQQFLTFEKIKNAQYNFPLLLSGDEIPSQSQDLIEKLLVKEPYDRIGAKDFNHLKQHKFFNEINFNNIFSIEAPKLPIKQINQQQSKNQIKLQSNISTLTTSSIINSKSSIMQGMVQKRSFIIYVITYLTLEPQGYLTMAKPQSLDKPKTIYFQANNPSPAQTISNNKFSISTVEKKYIIKSDNALEWVKVINENRRIS